MCSLSFLCCSYRKSVCLVFFFFFLSSHVKQHLVNCTCMQLFWIKPECDSVVRNFNALYLPAQNIPSETLKGTLRHSLTQSLCIFRIWWILTDSRFNAFPCIYWKWQQKPISLSSIDSYYNCVLSQQVSVFFYQRVIFLPSIIQSFVGNSL